MLRHFLGPTMAMLAAGGTALACGDGATAASPGPSVDAGAGDAAATLDGSACLAPTAGHPLLEKELTDRIAKLTGEAEAAPGVRLADRATADNRRAARAYLAAELRALAIETSIDDYATGANVVGRLRATTEGASEFIVVGAHFDTVAGSAGANDNATGVAAVLAVARVLSDLPCRSHGVMFVLFDEEEIGLLGSKAFVAAQQASGTRLVAAHTVDQVGWDSDGDVTFEIERPTPELFAEYQAGAAAVGAKVVETKTSTSDHQSFRARGIAAAGITEEYVNGDTTPEVHSARDRASTVRPAYHALAVRLVAYVVARELGAQ